MGRIAYCIVMLWLACGPAASGNDTDGSATSDSSIVGDGSSLRGTVWAPGNGPGSVESGYEIPVPGALVYLTVTLPEAIPQYAHCEQCVPTPGSSATTDPKGGFVLSGIVPGEYILVIQKGQFRREQAIVVDEGDTELASSQTTLPNTHDPDGGLWIPKMALATGAYDDLQDVLGKMGIGGSVDDAGKFVPAPETGSPTSQLHFYYNGGFNDYEIAGTLTELVSDLERMKQYHIIFIPCSGEVSQAALRTEATVRNIRDYVAAGGKFYAADWSGEWIDNVFPAQMQFRENDTPASAYDPVNDTWQISQFGNAIGYGYTSENAEGALELVHAWLDQQISPHAGDEPDGPIDASDFTVVEVYTTIDQLTPVQVGLDSEGIPVFDSPTAIVVGGHQDELPKRPLTVSFQPAGCGRVIFSGSHTAHRFEHSGLLPQERLLTYLIMEIGECSEAVIID